METGCRRQVTGDKSAWRQSSQPLFLPGHESSPSLGSRFFQLPNDILDETTCAFPLWIQNRTDAAPCQLILATRHRCFFICCLYLWKLLAIPALPPTGKAIYNHFLTSSSRQT